MNKQRPDAAAYARVFEGHHEGAQILDDLISRFGGALFVKGGEEGRRQTDFNLGRRAVLDFIVGQVNRANDVPSPDDDSQPAA
jgi:uncharacterized protein (DUF1330 family)